jgi:excisionase family DNA binding protein
MADRSELVTVEEMARMLRVPRSWIYSRTRMKGPNSIPRVQVGKYIRFNPSQVLEWINRAQVITQRT